MKLFFFIREIRVDERPLLLPGDREESLRQILFCTDGSGSLRGPARNLSVAAGELLIDPRGRIRPGPEGIDLVQVLFSEELFSPTEAMDREALYVLGIIKLHARRQNRISLSGIGRERISTLLDNMLWEFRERRRGYSWALRLKLIELLITVIRDKRFTIPIRGLKPLSNTQIQDVILYLNSYYMNPISVEEILTVCNLSRSHFHALFKQETGQTLISYLSALRCEKAAELLQTTSRTVLAICQETGFNNLSHFYHTFKRRFGVSPGEFRGATTTARRDT